jgi:hypothetical protein
MNRQKTCLFVVTALLIVGAAGVLVRLKAGQRLGDPGLRVRPAAEGAGLQIDLPAHVLQCESTVIPASEEERATLPKDTTISKRYYKLPDGFEALLTVVMMGTDRTSIHKPQFCLTGQGWKIERTEQTSIRVERPHPYDLPVMKLTSTKLVPVGDGRQVPRRGIYVYWFVADGQVTAQHWQRMWWMARDLVQKGVLQRWAYVSYFAHCAPGEEEATYRRLAQLIAATVPEFQRATPTQVAVAQ